MYERHKVCPILCPEYYCFIVEQYRAGEFDRVEHLHVAKRKISKHRALEVLRILVARYWGGTGMNAELVVSALVNGRKGDPHRSELFGMHVAYNEPGALRTYCGQNTKAWLDEVLDSNEFHKGRSDHDAH